MTPEPDAAIDAVLLANYEFSRGFAPPHVPPRPRKGLALVMCMDARIDPAQALGVQYGDAHIIRNAGGRVSDALRSIAASQALLGTNAVMIIHHTRCAMEAPGDQVVRDAVKTTTGAWIPELPFHTFRSLEESVRDDLAMYRACRYVRQDIPVRGFIYNVETGRLNEVG